MTAAALLIDYLLTAAVSLTAGVEAIASAIPALWPYRVEIALVLLFVIAVANLRGVREIRHTDGGPSIHVPLHLHPDAGNWAGTSAH